MVRGVLYPSITAAAEANGVPFSTAFRLIERGRPDDIGRKLKMGWRSHTVRVRFGDTWYESITAAAQALGRSRNWVMANAEEKEKRTWHK